jgi:hypothetical protein
MNEVDEVDLVEYLTKLRTSALFLANQPYNEQVADKVFGNLPVLIPRGIHVDQAVANVIGFAVRQLCLADEVDWLKLIGLSADICRLWNSEWTKIK